MVASKIILKNGRDKSLRQRHPWIFSGAVAELPTCEPGALLSVHTAQGDKLGEGYFNPRCSLLGRMLSFGTQTALDGVRDNLDRAISLRRAFFAEKPGVAYRVIHGEGDGIPGLVVDRYDDLLIMQVGTAGIDKLKSELVRLLLERLPCRTVYERSRLPTRKEEGLGPIEQLLAGPEKPEVEIREGNARFIVSLLDAQKTGFFLDQRDMRLLVHALSHGKRVLNCFSYTGGFSVHAALGGASQVDSVDISDKAIALARRNCQLNGLSDSVTPCLTRDAFTFLRESPLQYDLVILDPPAFAKKKNDLIPACRGYKEINRLAIQKMPKDSLLLTCSCSHHVDEKLFQTVLFQAALDAGRNVRLISGHRQALDHPQSIYHPEGRYLKSALLWID